tara:strand:- start:270 stop:662 length:393 start_codon:yes stop_codon:yes gene_type:complete
MTMTDSITELFEELVADGNDADDLQAFIDKYGKSQFVDYIEEYLQAIDESNEEAVEAFLDNFNIEDIGYFTDAYQGQWDSGAEFAQNLAEDCCEVPRDMSGWIEIDWKASWENLSYDYFECNGYIFSQNF